VYCAVFDCFFRVCLPALHTSLSPSQHQPMSKAAMSYADPEEAFEDLWDQMEELSKSCDEADGKLSRAIARHLVHCVDLPQSYRIRAHMALASLLCAQDNFRDAKTDYAEVGAKISAGLHAALQTELHAELQAIKMAYKKDAMKTWGVTLDDEPVEDTSASTLAATDQLGPGSQDDPIDLTLEDDSSLFENIGNESFVDSGYAEASDISSTRFSLPPRSMIILSTYFPTKASLTAVSALLFIHPSTMPLSPTLTTLLSIYDQR
jgi:hypothetical protein